MRVTFLDTPMNNGYNNVVKHSPNLSHNITTSHSIGYYDCNPVFVDELTGYIDIDISRYKLDNEYTVTDEPTILNAKEVRIDRTFGGENTKIFPYFYFITRYELRNYKVYRFYLELDVFTTFDIASALPNNLPVERTHLKRWSSFDRATLDLVNNLDIANLINIPENVGVSTFPSTKITLCDNTPNNYPMILWRYVWMEDNREVGLRNSSFICYAVDDKQIGSPIADNFLSLLVMPVIYYPNGIDNEGKQVVVKINNKRYSGGGLSILQQFSNIKIIGSCLSFISPNQLCTGIYSGKWDLVADTQTGGLIIDDTTTPVSSTQNVSYGIRFDSQLENYVVDFFNINNVGKLVKYNKRGISIRDIIGDLDFEETSVYDVRRETKYYSSEFAKIKLKDFSNESGYFIINKMFINYNDNIPVKYKGIMTPTGTKYNYYIDIGEYAQYNKYGYGNNAVFNGELPFKSDAYVETIRNSRNFMLQGMVGVGAKAIKTLTSVKNPIAFANNAVESIGSLSNLLLERDNLINAPSKINTDGYDLIGSLSITNPFPYIEFDDVTEEGKRIIGNLFYNYGYNVMTCISKNLLFSRHYFNYLKLYEGISDRLPNYLKLITGEEVKVGARVKAKIAEVLQMGTKFWNFDKYDSDIDFNSNINDSGDLLENWEIDLLK